jgi:peptidoglycan/xylan/chitin deacetylase (PgdA/CDA1 family)
LPAQPVTLGAGAGGPAESGQASLTGAIKAGEIHPYRLPLSAGQQLSVTVASPYDNVWLSIFGSEDRTVLRSIRSDTTSWVGSIPTTQEYLVSAVAPGGSSAYTLTIDVSGTGNEGPGAAVLEVTPTAAAGTQVVHLAIDATPGEAAALLDVLESDNARADFFIDARQAGETGDVAAALAAGHGLGLIASPIRALTSDARDALFAEVSAANHRLGDVPAPCLRLPAAARDSYTRAQAAELGYEVLQWDLDAGSAVDADTVMGQIFPGAVIRLQAGEDGDSLAASLEAFLPALTRQGYSVQPLCGR